MLRSATTVSILLAVTLLLPAGAAAQTGSWMGRLRVISFAPDDSSSEVLETGGHLGVDSATTLEADVSYWLSERLAVELSVTSADLDVAAHGGEVDGTRVGSVSVLPVSAALQYHFETLSKIQPYVGVGVNYTLFYGADRSADLVPIGITDVKYTNSVGFVANLGVDFDLDEHWLANLDLKYVGVSSDLDLRARRLTAARVSLDVNPWIFGAGIGYRF